MPGAKSALAGGRKEEMDLRALKGDRQIIWYHNIHYSSPQTLERLLDTKFATHIMLACGHRMDLDYQSQTIRATAGLIRKHGIPFIWTRPLWPVDNPGPYGQEILYQPEYYLGEISALRREAAEIGAAHIGLDIEPYGNAPTKRLFKSNGRADIKCLPLQPVISQVWSAGGKVDYILPAGNFGKCSPYVHIARLGDHKISEDTYYFYREEKYLKIDYPYDIMGIYFKEDMLRGPEAADRLKTIIGSALLLTPARGLFLYPEEKYAQHVVDLLSRVLR